jgi:CubicO group peptidase (beta-lactamase class C family)
MAKAPPVIVCAVVDGELRGEPPDILLPWWSITKTAIAACALVLAAGGRLELDRELPRRRFSLRHLLQHTSGLGCYTETKDYTAAIGRRDDPWTADELLAHAERAPKFEPGQGWSYSNTGYFLVRRLIERTTGTDIETALKTLVLGPLGIESPSIAGTRAELRRCAFGHEQDFHPGWVSHGLLIGTPADAALFMHRLFTGTLLPPPLRDAMRQRFPVNVPLVDRPWRTAGYGLGLMMDIASPHGLCIGHSGQGPDSVAAAYHFPDLAPPRSVAAFAPTDQQGVVESAALDEAARLR